MKIVFFGSQKFFSFYKDALESAGHKMVDLEKGSDLGVIAYYGKILKSDTLKIPKYGFINIHPSLLPRYRGPSPARSAILAGDTITGVTIHITAKKVDAGAVLARKEAPINPEDNYEKLEEKLFKMGARLLPETIDGWMSGKIIPQKQDESKATYTKLIKKNDGLIDWSRGAEYIERMTRAYNPWPGTFTKMKNGKILKIKKVEVKNGVLKILVVQPESKKEMSWKEFLNGYRKLYLADAR